MSESAAGMNQASVEVRIKEKLERAPERLQRANAACIDVLGSIRGASVLRK